MMNTKVRSEAMLEFSRRPDEFTDIDNLAGRAEPCIAYHRLQSDGISYFNSRGQLVTKHYGKTSMIMEITRYHYAEALRTQDNPPYFNEWARKLHLAHMYSNCNLEIVSRSKVENQSRLPLFPPSAPVMQNRLPHLPIVTSPEGSKGANGEPSSKRVRIISVESEAESLEVASSDLTSISNPFDFPEDVRRMIDNIFRIIPEDSNTRMVQSGHNNHHTDSDHTIIDPCSPSYSPDIPSSSQRYQYSEYSYQSNNDSLETDADATAIDPCSPSDMPTYCLYSDSPRYSPKSPLYSSP